MLFFFVLTKGGECVIKIVNVLDEPNAILRNAAE